MSRRRKIDSENVGERVSTSLRMPVELLKRIDDKWKSSDEFTGRTHFIEKACEYYLDCEPCPKCGNLNSKESVVCSHCQSSLGVFQVLVNSVETFLKEVEKSVESIEKACAEYNDLDSKIQWLLEKLSPENAAVINSVISDMYPYATRAMNAGQCFLKYHKIYSKYNKYPVPHPAKLTLDVNNLEVFEVDDIFLDEKTNLSLTLNTASTCIQANYYSRQARLMIENLTHIRYSELFEVHSKLVNKYEVPLLSIVDDVKRGIETLRSIEKMITVLMQNQNP